ncbi:hypothetical protein HYV88_00530 [Candidatus Woesearchaeota archaeon]|nr:hypothetical protein [Candidatus Woesearchaeota archaeon]
MAKEHVLHLRRHLNARPAELRGVEIEVPGTKGEKAEVGKGVFPDKIVRLNPGESQKGYEIGKKLYVPKEAETISVLYSPLRRAEDTAAYIFLGLLSQHPELRFLDMRTTEGLNETRYSNSEGQPDDGNELVAIAYNKTVNPDHPSYRLMIQLALQGNDPRVEPARVTSERGLRAVIPYTLSGDVCLAASHQPNLELIAAELVGYQGTNEKELVSAIGGDLFPVGQGLQLKVFTEEDRIVHSYLERSDRDFKAKVDKGLIEHYKGLIIS